MRSPFWKRKCRLASGLKSPHLKKRPPEGGPSTFFRCKTGASTQAPKWCAKYPVFCQRIQPIKSSQLIAISAKTLPASAHTGHFLRARTRQKAFNCRNKDIDTSCLDNAHIADSASKHLHAHGARRQKHLQNSAFTREMHKSCSFFACHASKQCIQTR